MTTTLKSLAALLIIAAPIVHAGSITVYDEVFQLKYNGVTVTTGSYEIVWGTYSTGVFTPYLGNANNSDNSGYADVTIPELSVSFSAASNVNAVVGSTAAMAILYAADNAPYSVSTPQIILTDPSWTVPAFSLTGPDLDFSFTSNTTAYNVGAFASTFSYNAGNEIINIATAAIPEPSSFAALAGLAMLGFAGMRKRRSA